MFFFFMIEEANEQADHLMLSDYRRPWMQHQRDVSSLPTFVTKFLKLISHWEMSFIKLVTIITLLLRIKTKITYTPRTWDVVMKTVTKTVECVSITGQNFTKLGFIGHSKQYVTISEVILSNFVTKNFICKPNFAQ